ncbi:MAG: aspartate/glutamate racemase family protein [Pseudomonadota bacterium]
MNVLVESRLGILMLDTRFPRIPGDVGNPATWDFPVSYRVVAGATPQAIVCEDTAPFVEAFVDAGKTLVAQGCSGIATTCGFLSLVRPTLAARLGVPVAASALEQAAQIKSMLGKDRSVGVLTISAASLTSAHLTAAAVPEDTIVAGMDGTGFAETILGNLPHLDVARARAEMVMAAEQLILKAPHTDAILLECTNMVPYAPAIAAATRRPVYSIYTYLRWFHDSLAPATFADS